MKRKCTDCGEEKEANFFSKRPNYNGTQTTYYRSMCKRCASKRMSCWRKKNRKKYNSYQTKYKREKNGVT